MTPADPIVALLANNTIFDELLSLNLSHNQAYINLKMRDPIEEK